MSLAIRSDLNEWKQNAIKKQKNFYNNFNNQRFQAYDVQTEKLLLRTKINYSLFGLPKKEVDSLEEAYDSEQNEASNEIVKKIIEAFSKVEGDCFCVSIIFIYCYAEQKEFCEPLFCVSGNGKSSKYVDTQGRTYSDWNDWKNNNKWQKMEYCYPLNGYYSCSWSEFEYDEKKEPLLVFGKSPACSLGNAFIQVADITTAVVGLGAGALTIASLVTPVGWGLVAAAGYAGVGAMGGAVYGLGRSAYQIIDKATHDENMLNLESFMLYGSVVMTPLNFVAGLTSAKLAQQAIGGSIGSSSLRSLVTVLNVTALTVDGAMLIMGVVNLIEKANKGQLEALDVVQLSMSVFFFSHTLIQPKTANQVIKKAQAEHIGRVGETIDGARAKKVFDDFVNDNGGDIRKDSNVIRTLRRMDDVDQFFKDKSSSDSIKVGGRKGKTVLVTKEGIETRVNPNKPTRQSERVPPKINNVLRTNIAQNLEHENDEFDSASKESFSSTPICDMKQPETSVVNTDIKIVGELEKICKKMNVKGAMDFISTVEILQIFMKNWNTSKEMKDKYNGSENWEVLEAENSSEYYMRRLQHLLVNIDIKVVRELGNIFKKMNVKGAMDFISTVEILQIFMKNWNTSKEMKDKYNGSENWEVLEAENSSEYYMRRLQHLLVNIDIKVVRELGNIFKKMNVKGAKEFFSLLEVLIFLGKKRMATSQIKDEQNGTDNTERLEIKIEEIELNPEQIFENTLGYDMGQLERSIAGEDVRIVLAARKMCEDMNIARASEFISIVEMVEAHVAVEHLPSEDVRILVSADGDAISQMRAERISNLLGEGRFEFVSNLRDDLKTALRFAENNDLKFSDDYSAIHHYRKHKHEFALKPSTSIECFLGDIPSDIYNPKNWTSSIKLPNGLIKEQYVKADASFLVVRSADTGEKIMLTLFKNLKAWKKHLQNLKTANLKDHRSLFDLLSKNWEDFAVHPPIYVNNRNVQSTSLDQKFIHLLKATSLEDLLNDW